MSHGPNEIVNVHMSLSGTVFDKLESLAEQSEVSIPEQVRRCIQLYDMIAGQIRAGNSMWIKVPNEEFREIIIAGLDPLPPFDAPS